MFSDVFEYEIDNTMALYGHIPFLMAHGVNKQTNTGFSTVRHFFSKNFISNTKI